MEAKVPKALVNPYHYTISTIKNVQVISDKLLFYSAVFFAFITFTLTVRYTISMGIIIKKRAIVQSQSTRNICPNNQI